MPAFATIATAAHVFEAEILPGSLASAEIPAWLADAQIVTADWSLSVAVGGVKVRVPAERAGEARALLAAPAVLPEPFEPPTPAEVAARKALTRSLLATNPVSAGVAVYLAGRVVATARHETARTWRRALIALLLAAGQALSLAALLGLLAPFG